MLFTERDLITLIGLSLFVPSALPLVPDQAVLILYLSCFTVQNEHSHAHVQVWQRLKEQLELFNQNKSTMKARVETEFMSSQKKKKVPKVHKKYIRHEENHLHLKLYEHNLN